MCGVVGYIGYRKAVPVLINGLRRLEYRGYDSAGLVVLNEKEAKRFRCVGRVQNLDKLVQDKDLPMTCGIAHTRWATHGKATVENAHPHTDPSERFYVIHNGIIENHAKLREQLISEGATFTSETDTEVVIHLVAKFYKGCLATAVEQVLKIIEGAFGLAVTSTEEPDKIIVARRGSPIVLGIGEKEMFVASDISALIQYTDQVIYMEDNEFAILTADDYKILSFDHTPIERETFQIDWKVEDEDLGSFPHYMLKEIFEQPETVKNAIRGRVIQSEGVSKLGGLQTKLKEIQGLKRLIIISCGTSYHAGLIGRQIFEQHTDLLVEVELASEFRYRRLRLDETTAVLAISQSGETIDTLAAIREAQRKGALTIGLVNVVGSTIARETDCGVYCHAGPEIGVASTKIFVSQLVLLNLIALLIGRYQSVSLSEGISVIKAIKALPEQIQDILARAQELEELARKYYTFNNCFFLGRQIHYPVAMEGALKLKEISYIHAESYAAGEMKHGPISLIDENFPTIAVLSNDASYEKMLNNVQEIKARSGPVLAITFEGDKETETFVDDLFRVPSTHELLQPVLTTIPLQLFAYYCARFRGTEIDKPRNLAKSVTVE